MSPCQFEDGGDNVISNLGSLKLLRGSPGWLSAKHKIKQNKQKTTTIKQGLQSLGN